MYSEKMSKKYIDYYKKIKICTIYMVQIFSTPGNSDDFDNLIIAIDLVNVISRSSQL